MSIKDKDSTWWWSEFEIEFYREYSNWLISARIPSEDPRDLWEFKPNDAEAWSGFEKTFPNAGWTPSTRYRWKRPVAEPEYITIGYLDENALWIAKTLTMAETTPPQRGRTYWITIYGDAPMYRVWENTTYDLEVLDSNRVFLTYSTAEDMQNWLKIVQRKGKK